MKKYCKMIIPYLYATKNCYQSQNFDKQDPIRYGKTEESRAKL